MRLIICPGVHDPALTESFLAGLWSEMGHCPAGQWPLVFPAQHYPAYSSFHLLSFLNQQLSGNAPDALHSLPLLMVAFSAGVAAAIGAAWGWQLAGGQICGLIAVDGWGVPLAGRFPVYRVSHDYFTHWSSALLGAGKTGFYAEPGVDHLALWRSPQRATGWQISTNPIHPPVATTAARFIATLIHQSSLQGNQ